MSPLFFKCKNISFFYYLCYLSFIYDHKTQDLYFHQYLPDFYLLKAIKNFHFITNITTPQPNNFYNEVIEFTISVFPSQAIKCYYIQSLYDLRAAVEKGILKCTEHFHYMTNMTTLEHKNLLGSSHLQFRQPFLNPPLFIIIECLISYSFAQEQKKGFSKNNTF